VENNEKNVFSGVYKDQCPGEPRIPNLLIAGGSLILLGTVFQAIGAFLGIFGFICKGCASLLGFAFSCWLIAACIIVYGSYSRIVYDEDLGGKNHCDKTMYRFSFWYITLTIFLVPAVLCAVCCLGGFTVALAKLFGGFRRSSEVEYTNDIQDL